MQGYVLPGFSRYSVDKKPDGSWGVRSYVHGVRGAGTAGRKPGSFLPGRESFKLKSDSGDWKVFKLKKLVLMSGAVQRQGIEIPGFSDYRLDRRADGRWGIRSYRSSRGASLGAGAFLNSNGANGREAYSPASDDGSIRPHQLGHFVLLAHGHPKPFPEAVVRHLDDDPANVEIGNLAWGSTWENAQDRIRNGGQAHGTRGAAKLDDGQVRQIFLRYHDDGEDLGLLAEEFGVSRSAVQCITSRTTWRRITEDLVDGRRLRAAGTDHLRGDLASEIASRYLAGEGTHVLAQEYRVSPASVRLAVHRATGSDVVDRKVTARLSATARGHKFTADQAREIFRSYHELGMSQSKIAEKFGTTQANVSFIVLRKTWAHATEGMPTRSGPCAFGTPPPPDGPTR